MHTAYGAFGLFWAICGYMHRVSFFQSNVATEIILNSMTFKMCRYIRHVLRRASQLVTSA